MKKRLFIHANSLSPKSFLQQTNGNLSSNFICDTLNLNELLNGDTGLNGKNLFPFLSCKIVELQIQKKVRLLCWTYIGSNSPSITRHKRDCYIWRTSFKHSLANGKGFLPNPDIVLAFQSKLTRFNN